MGVSCINERKHGDGSRASFFCEVEAGEPSLCSLNNKFFYQGEESVDDNRENTLNKQGKDK
jgi:hypothetical protein